MERNFTQMSFVGLSCIGHVSPFLGSDGALGVSLPMTSGEMCVPSALHKSERHSLFKYSRQLLKIWICLGLQMVVHTSFIKILSFILLGNIGFCVGTISFALLFFKNSLVVSIHNFGTCGNSISGVSHGGFSVPATRWYHAYAICMVVWISLSALRKWRKAWITCCTTCS